MCPKQGKNGEGEGCLYVKTELANTVNGEMCCQLENDYVLTLNKVSGTNG